ncbi:MAG: tRNA (adenine22-N1)-methyltransferase [Clostridia bacterium]|nr:tRNA (adenine22-N1)-methyltransferase [Clostridia bacterium]
MLTFFNRKNYNSKKYKLSKRLHAVSSFISLDSRIADIGTDHALLPLYLASRGICKKIIGIEGSLKPYKRALANVREAGFADEIDIRLGNGLAPLEPGEVDLVAMAGLGAINQQDILADSPEVTEKLKRIVLQPQGEVGPLRRWLAENDWCLIGEDLVFEGGHYYFILATERGKSPKYSDIEWQLGPLLLKQRHLLLPGYVLSKMVKLTITIGRLANSRKAEAQLRREKLIQELTMLREVFIWLRNVKK